MQFDETSDEAIQIKNEAGIKSFKNPVNVKEFPVYEEGIPQFSKDLLHICKNPLSPKTLRVIDPHDLTEHWEKLIRDRSEGGEKERTFFQKAFEPELKSGRKMFARKLISARSPECLSSLSQEFPHFERSGIINAFREDLILSRLSGGGLFLAPTIMRSEPGFGKNRFVRRVCEVLGIPVFYTFDFSSATAGWGLSGLSSSWSGSKPGAVFQSLTSTKGDGNPLFFVDEIEKGSSPSNTSRPLDCLHALLEKESALTFRDEFCPIPLNTSRIIWLAASNSLDNIPQSIISRFRVFDIPSPTPEEKRGIVKSIWTDLVTQNHWGKHLNPDLSEEVLDIFENDSPRIIQLILRSSCARALSKSEGKPPKEKIQLTLKDIVSDRKTHVKKRPVGFHLPTFTNKA